ncbi:hypothetical protein CR513_10375, partial [Mucuna pruriens]
MDLILSVLANRGEPSLFFMAIAIEGGVTKFRSLRQLAKTVNATIQDLKTQIGQLANTVSHLQSAGSSNLPSQTIPNLRGNASAVTLRSGKELSSPAP